MALRSLLLIFCFALMNVAFADNRHVYPKADAHADKANNKAFLPGYCQIEIINSSFDHVTVYGVFDDGLPLTPFNVTSFGSPHYISLYYYNYCHSDMYLDVVTFSGYHIYSGITRTNTSLRIIPYLKNQVRAEIISK